MGMGTIVVVIKKLEPIFSACFWYNNDLRFTQSRTAEQLSRQPIGFRIAFRRPRANIVLRFIDARMTIADRLYKKTTSLESTLQSSKPATITIISPHEIFVALLILFVIIFIFISSGCFQIHSSKLIMESPAYMFSVIHNCFQPLLIIKKSTLFFILNFL